MSAEAWGALITLLTTLAGIGRWHLAVSHKNKMKQLEKEEEQAKKIENLKSQNARLQFEKVEQKLKSFELMLVDQKEDLVFIRAVLNRHSEVLDKQDEFITSVKQALAKRDAEVKNLQSHILKLNDELVMIKSKKNGT